MNDNRGPSSPTPPPTPTITECFKEKLPFLELSPKICYKTVQASGTATKAMQLPGLLRYLPIERFEKTADECLQEKQIKKRLGQKEIFSTCPEIAQESEADIITSSGAYIIQPIIEVLRVMYPNQWKVHGEWTETTEVIIEDVKKVGQNQTVQERTLRYDLLFKKPPNGDKDGDTILIVEYKRRRMIKYENFADAVLGQGADPEKAKDIANKAKKGKEKTALQGNGIPYCKQVSKYAATARCKHVALFNWDHLLLFNFNMLQPGLAHTAGQEAQVSWVQESEGSKEFMEEGIIRKVLLGWMLIAFKDAGIHR